MRARTLVLAILLLPALAGCTTPRDLFEAPTIPAQTHPWGLRECSYVVAVLPASAARVQQHLPDGFRALAPQDVGLPRDARGADGNVGVEAWRCGQGVGSNNTTLESPVYGATFAFVEPPAELKENGTRFYFVKWDVLIPDEARRTLLEDAGVTAYNGSVTLTRGPAALDRAFVATLAMNGTYTMRGAAAQASNLTEFRFVEFTAVPDGLVVWRASVAGTALGGAGTVALPPGRLRDVVGSDSAQAFFLSGTASFEPANFTLPARRP